MRLGGRAIACIGSFLVAFLRTGWFSLATSSEVKGQIQQTNFFFGNKEELEKQRVPYAKEELKWIDTLANLFLLVIVLVVLSYIIDGLMWLSGQEIKSGF